MYKFYTKIYQTMSFYLPSNRKKIQASSSLAAVLIASLVALSGTATIRPVLAQPATDPQGDSPEPNFDIKTFGFKDDGKIFIQLYGKAARTLPVEDHVGYAYVFDTDNGVWAINGHREPHSTAVPEWHAERIFVDGDCIKGIDVPSERTPMLAGTNAMVKATGVTKIFSVQTVQFRLNVDEPDNPPPGTECVANVVRIFDSAAGST